MATNTLDQVTGKGETVAVKAPCVVETTANITLSGTQTINSVAVVADDRVLVKNQTDSTENGIYICGTGLWQRSADFNEVRDITNGTLVPIADADPLTFYKVTYTEPLSFGTTALTFVAANGGITTVGVVDISQYGIIADWDGVTGTDQTAALQTVIDSFAGARTHLTFGSGRYRFDSARIDFKKVTLLGVGLVDNAGGSDTTGGVEFYVGASGGFYTSIEDNAGPRLENLRFTSSSEKLQNGQTVLDMTGINYPRLNNITIYGGDVGLKIAAGATVESHYSTFTNVNLSRCYHGIAVLTGPTAQTHNFFGGRCWDCFIGYFNGDTGASDINFYGTAFESDTAIEHAPTATAAQTKWFACRNESAGVGDIRAGQFTQVGTYWSGNRRPISTEISPTGASGEISELDNQVKTIGANNSVDMAGPNVLPNPLFSFDPSKAATDINIIAGWVPFGATHYDSGKAMEGNYIRCERQAASGTIGLDSPKFTLKKGRYVFSCGFAKDGYGVSGTTNIDFLKGGVTIGTGGTDADLTFPQAYAASEFPLYVDILQDIDDFQFRITVTASIAGRYFYVYQPQLIAGTRAVISAPSNAAAVSVDYGQGPRVTGRGEVGDIIYNTEGSIGAPMGWKCITSGSPGTWLSFGILHSVSATGGNGSYTVTFGSSDTTQRITAALTANRTITLDTASAIEGAKFRVVRTATSTGAFTTDVGGLKALATGEWCDVEYDGAAWLLTAFGAL